MNKIADIATNENGERQTPTTKIKKNSNRNSSNILYIKAITISFSQFDLYDRKRNFLSILVGHHHASNKFYKVNFVFYLQIECFAMALLYLLNKQ